jgi:ferredoxin
VCPATATDYSQETGIVSQIYTRCFGCRYCMGACPYHARYFNWWDPVWPDGMEKYLSPNVSPRMRGVVEKCSFCFHRYQLAKNKAYMDGESIVPEGGLSDRLHPGLPGRRHRFRRSQQPGTPGSPDRQPDPKNGNKSKNPGLSAAWSALAPTPRYTTCPTGNGSVGPETTTSPMKKPGRSPSAPLMRHCGEGFTTGKR